MKLRIGGDLLGQGTFGCVFKPAVLCPKDPSSGKDTTRFTPEYLENGATPTANDRSRLQRGVSKLVFDDAEYMDERKSAALMRTIDPKAEFTNPLLGSCPMQMNQVRDLQGMNRCSPAMKSRTEKAYNLVFEHHGTDLFRYGLGNEETLTKLNFASESLHIKILGVCRGIKKMLENDFVHMDIKPANMLNVKKKILLIDFGLSSDLKEVLSREFKGVVTHAYPYYPPELKLYWNKLTRENWMVNYTPILTLFLAKLDVRPLTLRNSANSLMTTVERQIKSRVSKEGGTPEEHRLTIFTEFIQKLDIFSLGISLLEMFAAGDSGNMTPEQLQHFKRILRGMTNMNPFDRYDIDRLIKDYTAFVDTLSKAPASPPKVSKAESPKGSPSLTNPSFVTARSTSSTVYDTPDVTSGGYISDQLRRKSMKELKEYARLCKCSQQGSKAALSARLAEYIKV
jgi:serine/threonine protein kinase